MTSHTRPWKEKQLAELKQLIKKYHVIAVADISTFPAALFQVVRKKLAGRAVIKVSKTKVIKKALKESGNSVHLVDHAKKNCAVIFTDMNPFELFAFLKKNKGKIPAKTGAIAEEDIKIPAGDTGLPPGPALSDLKAAGLKVAVQGATIAIMDDKVVTKKGEPISAAVAGTLSKLNIKPFKVGLKLVAALEGAQIFKAEVLNIDTEEMLEKFSSAHRNAFNLAFNASIFTKETTELFVSKAFNNAKAVALEANFVTSATIGLLLAKANAQAKSVKGMVKDIPEDSKKEDA
ncbi:MAG TPA: 50S ribosomal protein L10 [archaeon]|nr:50S ribosomal protein L10 [archaeon]